MIPLRIHRALCVLFAVSGTLALLEIVFSNFGLSHEASMLLSGLCTGVMVFILAYEGGRVLLFCGKGLIDDPARRLKVRAALLDIGVLEERRSGARRARGRSDTNSGRRLPDSGPKELMYVTIVDSPRFIAITIKAGASHRAFISTHMVDTMSPGALRGVLGHEYGHVLSAHPFKLACVLGLVAAVKLTVGIPLPVVAVLLLTYLYMLRQWEFSADAQAVHRTSCADVRAAFDEYRAISQEKDMGRWAELISGHPSVHRRIEAIEREAATVAVVGS